MRETIIENAQYIRLEILLKPGHDIILNTSKIYITYSGQTSLFTGEGL
jgi:hypothetical protein